MSRVLVTTNPDPKVYVDIDLSGPEWESLLPHNIPSFKMEELRRPCTAYPDGVFPGSAPYGENKQITKIHKFTNYVEFSKVIADEVIPLSGQLYLTTKFYERREEGWKSIKDLQKSGEIIGYCINGDIHSAADRVIADRTFYGIVYESLVSTNPAYQKLKRQLRDGVCLTLISENKEFVKHLSDVLTTKP